MRDYYEVQSLFYDDGRCVAHIMGTVQASRKPKTRFKSLKRCDAYLDYFRTKDEAIAFVDEAKWA